MDELSAIEYLKNIGLFRNTNKTCLYVGASHRRVFGLKELCMAGYDIEIIEVFKPNVEFLKKKYKFPVIHGDIIKENIKKYDLIFWSHGPEHINKNDLEPVLDKLNRKCKQLVLLFPEGASPQGAVDGNINETHLNTLYASDFRSIGYKTKKCKGGSVAWRLND